jgi:hypothetical protein
LKFEPFLPFLPLLPFLPFLPFLLTVQFLTRHADAKS